MQGTTVRSRLRLMKAAQDTIGDEITADDGFSLQVAQPKARHNPLAELIDDETFAALNQYALFDRKSLRDYQIRKTYREMRSRMTACQALEQLQSIYSYLEFETIRKIIYAMASKMS